MLVQLLDDPTDFVSHIQRYTFSLTHQMIIGSRAVSGSDPHMVEFYSILQEFSKLASNTVASLLDIFPILRLLPSSVIPAANQANALRERESKALVKQWMQIKHQIKEGTAKVRIGPFQVDSKSLLI